jgi:hypothetical protein
VAVKRVYRHRARGTPLHSQASGVSRN